MAQSINELLRARCPIIHSAHTFRGSNRQREVLMMRVSSLYKQKHQLAANSYSQFIGCKLYNASTLC